jgi:hypothetical protein
MSVHILAGGPGPAMFLGSSIMSFALPYGAFIVIAAGLFVAFRAKHSGPRLRYLSSAPVTSVITREPGPVPAPAARSAAQAGESRPGGAGAGGDAAGSAPAEGSGDPGSAEGAE